MLCMRLVKVRRRSEPGGSWGAPRCELDVLVIVPCTLPSASVKRGLLGRSAPGSAAFTEGQRRTMPAG